MKIRTFIDRPILAGVISVLILILGFISLSQLPIDQFPEIKCFCICPFTDKEIFTVRFHLFFQIGRTAIPICISVYRHRYSPF